MYSKVLGCPDEKPDYGIIDMSADKAADYHKLEGGEKAFTNDYLSLIHI